MFAWSALAGPDIGSYGRVKSRLDRLRGQTLCPSSRCPSASSEPKRGHDNSRGRRRRKIRFPDCAELPADGR